MVWKCICIARCGSWPKPSAPTISTLQSKRTILEAANIVLRRPAKYFDEPVVLIYPDGTLRLLDTYMIIVAQNHLLNLVTQVEQNRRQVAESLQRIGRELMKSAVLTANWRRWWPNARWS